jgi:hypothetical protein
MVDELSDELIDALVASDAQRPAPESGIIIRALGGAISRIADDATAYPHRSARFNVSIDGSWHDPALDATVTSWVHSTWNEVAPFATGGVYVNFAGFENDTDPAATRGHHHARLAEISRAYDADGLFDAAALRP